MLDGAQGAKPSLLRDRIGRAEMAMERVPTGSEGLDRLSQCAGR